MYQKMYNGIKLFFKIKYKIKITKLGGKSLKFKKIKTKMLVSILPVIAVVLITLTLIAAVSCLNMVNTKVQ